MITWRPAIGVMGRLFGIAATDPEAMAREWWQIAPGETRKVRPAIFLPGQIERIRKTEFGATEEVIRDLLGDFTTLEGPTLGFSLRDADIVDGVLYAGRAARVLRPGSRARPSYTVPEERTSGVLYESWVGNRWFGNWLTDDCLAHALAERFGVPVATAPGPAAGTHMAEYEARLGIRPRRFARARFDELILLRDHANNADRRARSARMRALLAVGVDTTPHPGVFLVRGAAGERRMLANERDLAHRLRDERGFRVIDPMAVDAATVIGHCAGARVVVGVEGSHLGHGLMTMPPDATLLTLQAPDRVVTVLKIVTDRQGQGFGVAIGTGDQRGFRVDWAELAATLDLIEERHAG